MTPDPTPSNDVGDTSSRPAPGWQSWLETVALIAVLLTIGALVDGSDPFLLHRGFSWFALAPLLAGLQYGSARGMGCAAVEAGALAIVWKSGIATLPDSAAETVLGWLVVGLLAGEFRDAWLRRNQRLGSFADRLRCRLESLGRAYLALKISHDQLRRTAPSASQTLCDALSAFRREVAAQGEASLEAHGDRILQLFAEHASVRAATLHRVDGKGRPGQAIAALGPATACADDPLVRTAARTGSTLSIRDGGEGGAVLVAVPLVDVSCRARAVVAVRDVPFLALHAETLELLAVIGARLGDTLFRTPATAPLDDAVAAPLRAPAMVPVAARVEEVA